MSNTAAQAYRAKKLVTIRIDADVMEWLRSQGRGHLTRINQIVRNKMETEQRRQSAGRGRKEKLD
jgi:uncharacterized protein (DUF4415 family)